MITIQQENIHLKTLLLLFLIFLGISMQAQEQPQLTQEQKKAIQSSREYTYLGNEAYNNKKPIQAEMDYRQAIYDNSENAVAKYNLGNSYYEQNSYGEALVRYKQATTSKEASKEEKQYAYHNLGNIMMKEKQYDKAVIAYKQALREDPNDEETRYNLALAQDLLKKNPPKDKNKDNKDNKDNKNNNDQNKDKKDKKDKGNNKKDNGDQDKDKNKGDQNKNENKDQGNNQKDQQPQGDKKDNKNNQSNGQPQPSSISPKQIERILEALNNEEKKTQEKINAQKIQGRHIQTDKDW